MSLKKYEHVNLLESAVVVYFFVSLVSRSTTTQGSCLVSASRNMFKWIIVATAKLQHPLILN